MIQTELSLLVQADSVNLQRPLEIFFVLFLVVLTILILTILKETELSLLVRADSVNLQRPLCTTCADR